jgi:flagellar biosynthesis protein FliP
MMVRAKVIAAVIPAAALAGLLLIAAASQVGAASLAALPIVLISAWSAAAAVGADQKQVSRELFGKSNGADLPLQLLIFLIAALLTAAAVLLVTAYWLVGVILAALLLIFPVQQGRKLATLRADRLLA